MQRSTAKAFPFGEGGSPKGLTEEGSRKPKNIPYFGAKAPLPTSLCSATLPKGEGFGESSFRICLKIARL